MSDQAGQQPTVFISYSHEDRGWKDSLVKQLQVLSFQGILEPWTDDRIGSGEDWQRKIREAMERADVAVLLVSASSLSSEFILGEEVTVLLERREKEGLIFVPILVEPCVWEKVEWLRGLQCVSCDGEALASRPEPEREQALADVAREIDRRLTTRSSPAIDWPKARADFEWMLAGRQDEVDVICRVLTGELEQRILLFSSQKRRDIGVTWLLDETRRYAESCLKLPAARIDCKGGASLESVLGTISLDCSTDLPSPMPGVKEDDLRMISSLQQLTAPLLLFVLTYHEAAQEAKEWIEYKLLPRLNKAPGVVVLIGGHEVPRAAYHPWKPLSKSFRLKAVKEVPDWLRLGERMARRRPVDPARITDLVGENTMMTKMALESYVESLSTGVGA